MLQGCSEVLCKNCACLNWGFSLSLSYSIFLPATCSVVGVSRCTHKGIDRTVTASTFSVFPFSPALLIPCRCSGKSPQVITTCVLLRWTRALPLGHASSLTPCILPPWCFREGWRFEKADGLLGCRGTGRVLQAFELLGDQVMRLSGGTAATVLNLTANTTAKDKADMMDPYMLCPPIGYSVPPHPRPCFHFLLADMCLLWKRLVPGGVICVSPGI